MEEDTHQIASVDLTIGRPVTSPPPSHLSAHFTLCSSPPSPSISSPALDNHLPVLLFPCVSSESAQILADTINDVWRQATQTDQPDSFFSNLASSWKNDQTQLANLEAERENSLVKVTVTLVPWLLQHYKTYVFMLFQEVGDLLAHQQTVDISVAFNGAVAEAIHSVSPVLALFSYLKLTLRVCTWPGFMDRLRELTDKYLASPEILVSAGIFTLFESANISISFSSPEKVPQKMRDLLPNSEMLFEFLLKAKNALAADEKRVVDAVIQLVQGPVQLHWWTPYSALEVNAEVHGLAELLRR